MSGAKGVLLSLKDVQSAVKDVHRADGHDVERAGDQVSLACASFGCAALTRPVTAFLTAAREQPTSPSPLTAPLSRAVAVVKEHVAIERYCEAERERCGWTHLNATVRSDQQIVGAAHGNALLITEWEGGGTPTSTPTPLAPQRSPHGNDSHTLALVWRPGVTAGDLVLAPLRVRVDADDGTVYGVLLGSPTDAELTLAEWVRMLVPEEVVLWQSSAASAARAPAVTDLMPWAAEAELRCYRWWHPSWTRTEAERHLTAGGFVLGSCIVRRSSQPNTLALTHVTGDGVIDHALIHVRGYGDAFRMEQTTDEYPTLVGLLESYGVLLVQQRVADADGVAVTRLRAPANIAEAEAIVRATVPADEQEALLEACAGVYVEK